MKINKEKTIFIISFVLWGFYFYTKGLLNHEESKCFFGSIIITIYFSLTYVSIYKYFLGKSFSTWALRLVPDCPKKGVNDNFRYFGLFVIITMHVFFIHVIMSDNIC